MGGKKKQKKASRSDKRLQKLYEDAIKEAKEKNIRIESLPSPTNNEDCKDDASLEEKQMAQKPRRKLKEVLEESIRKKGELRKPRISFSVPVSRLIPFKLDERGLAFPRDFRRDATSQSWIPRSGKLLPADLYSGRRTPNSDLYEFETDIVCCNEDSSEENGVDEILQVLPLRVQQDGNVSVPETSAQSRQLPPIYRQELWRKTMCRASEPSRSIPAKRDAWNIRDPTCLMIGRQELFTQGKCRSSVSLAERRVRLRTASSEAILP